MSQNWKWPTGMDTIPLVSDEYGMRAAHPIYGDARMHWGIDLYGWSSVKASAQGTVIFAAYYGGAGNYVKVQHPGGTVTGYKHLARIDVSVNQTVSVGTHLGPMGTTGDSTGIHLHFETQMLNSLSPMNPRDFLRARFAEDTASGPAGGGTTPFPEGDDDMRTIRIILDQPNPGQSLADAQKNPLWASTAVINDITGFLVMSQGGASRAGLEAFTSISNTLGIPVSESHVDFNGWTLSSWLVDPDPVMSKEVVKVIQDAVKDLDFDFSPEVSLTPEAETALAAAVAPAVADLFKNRLAS